MADEEWREGVRRIHPGPSNASPLSRFLDETDPDEWEKVPCSNLPGAGGAVFRISLDDDKFI